MKFRSILWGILLILVMGGCKKDKRVEAFEAYLVARADSMAYDKCTEGNLQLYIKSYYKNGEYFDSWIDDLGNYYREIRRSLYNDCKIIRDLDKQEGRELSFEEALKIIMARPDTSANPDGIVMLQRKINVLDDCAHHLKGWEEARKYEKRTGYKPQIPSR